MLLACTKYVLYIELEINRPCNAIPLVVLDTGYDGHNLYTPPS